MPLSVVCRANDADKHEKDISALLFHKGKLYSAGDDGKIKVWSRDLVKQGEVQAHQAPVYGLTASADTLYSSSSDGSVRMFDLNTLQLKQALRENENDEYWRVKSVNGNLYVGDNEGNVHVFKNNEFYGTVNVAEPIKDMAVLEPFVLTVQDTDLVISEFKLGGPNIHWVTEKDIPGRAPVTLIGNTYIALIDRDGKEILLHSTQKPEFKQIAKIEHGSENDRVINALEGVVWGNQNILFSGGWDKNLKKWQASSQGLTEEASINIDVVINAIAAGDANQVFAGGADGHIARIDSN